jgi:tetratricopeptide (TPR) repeat protein
MITKDAGLIYYYAGQYDQAIAQCKRTLDMTPAFYTAHTALGEIYLRMGRRGEAIAEFLEADRLAEGRFFTRVMVGYAYAVSGRGLAH